MHSSSQVSRGCSGTWLWTNKVHTDGVEAHGQEVLGGLEGLARQEGGVVVEGHGMEVDDAEQGVEFVLVGDPVAERAQVVAEVELTARLDP